METSDILQLGIMLSTAAALLFTVSNFRKQLQLNFFAEYTKRYQEIILRFPESVNQKNDRDITLRYMRAYFDLCSEEYFLWKKGHIDNDTWKEWESGIKYAFSKAAFREAWNILRLDTIYYGEFTDFVASAISNRNTK